MTHSPTNHASIPTHSEERYHRCLSSHLGLTLTLTYPISCPGNALGSSETADLVSLSCHNSAILLLITRETLPNSGKSPSWHNNCCHDATTSLCVIRVRHDNVCVRLQGSKLRGAEGQNAPKLSLNAPRLSNLGAKFCYPIQPDICFEA